ncbi:hypothetical protein QWY93_14810 [Echinicola jeungdonensis]|uniref:Uncharacterized protein n=1 Tax=Echinicola jeungdonensis TaxID=709343 RepID=A0ABV5J329_9BACT|nr:hypothetical protein [Echinicola jeungdonensis]MDN3670591.1 hypothetical protein [Echinicola jeungdonensis]
MNKEANEHGYNVMVCQSKEKVGDEKKIVKALLNSKVDGLIISLYIETDEATHLEEFLSSEIPVVQVEKYLMAWIHPK